MLYVRRAAESVSGEKNAVSGKKVLWEKGLLVIERKMFYYSYYQGVVKYS